MKLTVQHEDGSIEVISTTDEHPFHVVHTGEWTRADALVIGDLLSTMAGVAELIAVEYGAERVPVYNLSIPGSPTYYVGTRGLWVHNCGFDQLFKIKYEHFMHRKGWDIITGKSSPTKGEVASVLEEIVSANAGHLKSNGVTDIVSMHNGHEIYVQVFSRADGMYDITSAGLRTLR